MSVDHEEILCLPEGIFRVKYFQLSAKQIRSLRTRWLSDVFKLRREIASLNRKILAKKQIIKQKEDMINKMTEENLQKLVKIEQHRNAVIAQKSNQFLKTIIGEKAFAELETNGFFCFTALDNKRYRIKSNGELQVDGGKYWYHCCYVKPGDLPLPDIIASVFNTVNQAKRFQEETVPRKTGEEVVQ